MNRRRFLASLASIPLVGRLVPKAKDPVAQIVRYTGPAIEWKETSPGWIRFSVDGDVRYLAVYDE